MASDILLHRADYVPVGKDQEQHLEMTRHLAHRFNQIYKTDFFNENVAAYNFGKDLVKIPGLDGSGKMGKSEGNGIYLSDPDNVIRKKVMKAVTDSGPTEPNSPISAPIKNIFTIMEAVSTPDTIEYFKEKYASCEIRYGDLKKQLAEDIISAVAPIRERIEDIRNNEKYLHEVTMLGAEKAQKSARATIDEVRRIMGIYKF
jgi:tryptophanyl-tRNA synthetase